MPDLTSGLMWSTTLPQWQRTYYEMLLLETLRMKSIMVPYCAVKTDYSAANSGIVTFTEVYDSEPNWNGLAETDIWLTGGHLDSRTVSIALQIHGDILKFSDYNAIVQYVNKGDMRGLVRDKIGQNQVDYLDILARNAYLSHPNKTWMNSKASRELLVAGDLFDPDVCEAFRVHLEENNIPGVSGIDADDNQTIVCVTTPRVIKDIRTGAGSKWLEVQEYLGTTRKLTGEVGMWNGIRFVRTNRLALRNYGANVVQTHVDVAIIPGAGAAATVDTVYTVGQTAATKYITVDATAGFVAGMYITVHDVAKGLGAGHPPVETDGTQETRKIVQVINGITMSVDKPFMKDHAIGALVTNGINVHSSIFMGGPGVVYGVGEAPNVIVPPKYDDLMIVNRYGWRGFLKFQLFRPEFFEVIESAGSTD